MSPFDFEPLSVQPADEVAGWRVLRVWRRDSFSVTWVVERDGERRLLRMALRPPGSREGRAMERYLEREAGALRRVQHPCIVRLHAEGRWPEPVHGFRYLLLDDVDGVDLLAMRSRGISALDVVAIFSRLALGVDAMRSAGVNHGSIGPRNIIVRADGQPVLVDFSLSHWPGNPHPLEVPSLSGFGNLEELFGTREEPPAFQIPIPRGKRYRS